MSIKSIEQFPRDIILSIAQSASFQTKKNLALVSKRFAQIVRDLTKSVTFNENVSSSEMRSFFDYVPRYLKKITITQGLSFEFIVFLEKKTSKIETLIFRQFYPTHEGELLLFQRLQKVKSLKTLEIIDSDLLGNNISQLSIKTLILINCSNITELVLPITVKHLDVSYSKKLTKVTPLNQLELLRAEEVNISKEGFKGFEYKILLLYEKVLPTLKSFLELGVNPNVLNDNEDTPLHLTVRSGLKETIALLLEKGANPNAANGSGQTPLHNAIDNDDKECTALLLKHGANPNAKNCRGETPLHIAARWGLKECLKLLHQWGADPNITDKKGDTPLHSAVSKNKIFTTTHLIELGVNINSSNHLGLTPLHVAVKNGSREVVPLLLAKGANPNAEDLDKMTPLDWAEKRNDKQMCSLLLEKGAIPRNRGWGSSVCM